MPKTAPVYIETYKNGTLGQRIKTANKILSSCSLCPRNCKVERTKDQTGICKTGKKAIVASYQSHFGEEKPLVGINGSGTIFFSYCNLLCNFCQNYDISHTGYGYETTPVQLANIMLHLQNMGCHNINFVSPTHIVPQILSALEVAIENGLNIPLVYNSSAYDTIETIKLLDGVIDIYMPDFKFWNSYSAKITCQAPDYPQKAKIAIKEMYRQAGDLKLDQDSIAVKGLLVRHLLMPDSLDETKNILRFIRNEISPDTYTNIMPQYHPSGKAQYTDKFNRTITRYEYLEALQVAKEIGLRRLDPD